jgi:hypothetical protein
MNKLINGEMDGQTDREIELMMVGIQTNRRMKRKVYRQMEERTDRQTQI